MAKIKPKDILPVLMSMMQSGRVNLDIDDNPERPRVEVVILRKEGDVMLQLKAPLDQISKIFDNEAPEEGEPPQEDESGSPTPTV